MINLSEIPLDECVSLKVIIYSPYLGEVKLHLMKGSVSNFYADLSKITSAIYYSF